MPRSTRLLAGASPLDQDTTRAQPSAASNEQDSLAAKIATGPEGEGGGVAGEGGGLGRGERGRRDGMFDNLPTQTVSGDGSYTAVLIVPTGIGAAIGGYAGDALPVAR